MTTLYRYLILVVLILGAIVLPALADSSPSGEIVAQNPELFAWLVGLMVLGGFSILGFMIKTSHDNNKHQWKTLNNHESRISRVEGVCETNHQTTFRRRMDDE